MHVLQPAAIAESAEDLGSRYAARYPASDTKRERASADITIYQIRCLIEDAQTRPFVGNRKVVILSPAEAMNNNAANSLLKLLEEPPPGSMLLLVTSHPARLPATIRSRCSRILFKSPTRIDGLAWLQLHTGGKAESATVLLELAGGAPLLAKSLMEEGFPEIRAGLLKDLDDLSLGREEPVACAARWKGVGARHCLGLLHGFVSGLIKSGFGQFNFFFRCKKRYLFKPFQILPRDIVREKRRFLFQFLLSLYFFSSFSLQAFFCCLDFKFFQ